MNDENPQYFTRQTLIIKLKNQYDENSWQDFINLYGNYIYSIINKLNVPTSDIADLNQIILLNLWKSLPNFDYNPYKGRFRSWLAIIVRRSVYAYFRSKKETAEIDEISTEAEIDKISEIEWKIHIANLAWENVKKEYSETVQNIYESLLRNEVPDEIAQKTGVARGTIYVYKERVEKSLRREVRRLDRELG